MCNINCCLKLRVGTENCVNSFEKVCSVLRVEPIVKKNCKYEVWEMSFCIWSSTHFTELIQCTFIFPGNSINCAIKILNTFGKG